jgi:hypothetical protein
MTFSCCVHLVRESASSNLSTTKTRAYRLIIEVCTTFQSTWRKDAALLDSAGVTHVQNTHRHAVVHQNCLNVTRVSVAIASISFVIIVPLVFEFRDELSEVLRSADAMYALRTVAYNEAEDCRGGRGTWVTIPSSWIG